MNSKTLAGWNTTKEGQPAAGFDCWAKGVLRLGGPSFRYGMILGHSYYKAMASCGLNEAQDQDQSYEVLELPPLLSVQRP